jgi:K+-sensing histidine kinase KdpD
VKRISLDIPAAVADATLWAVAMVAVLTAIMLFIGRAVLGEAVIAMLYLLVIAWFTSRAGQLPGLSAAISAALLFDFFFIPPFFTFNVGRVEGWLVLAIFVFVAVIMVNRIQVGLVQAQARERDALLVSELSRVLMGQCSQADVARALAGELQRLYQAAQVQVTFLPDGNRPAITASAGSQATVSVKPDYVVPIQTARRLSGEIRLWQAEGAPLEGIDRLLPSLASQITAALDRMPLKQASAR